MDDVIRLVAHSGFTLEFGYPPNGKKGYYLPSLKLIIINNDLDEDTQKEVTLHELYHAIKHTEFYVLYKIFVFRSKMEQEATELMLDYLIDESDGFFDYSSVLEHFKLNMGWEDMLQIKKYLLL